MGIKGPEWNGSFTVEAALVTPVVIGCLFLLIFMTFSLHDLTVLRATAAESAVSGWGDEEQTDLGLLYYRTYRWEQREKRSGLPVCTEHYYRVCYETAENDLMGRIGGILTGGNPEDLTVSVKGEASYIRCNPELLIWLCQVFLEDQETPSKADVPKDKLKD